MLKILGLGLKNSGRGSKITRGSEFDIEIYWAWEGVEVLNVLSNAII